MDMTLDMTKMSVPVSTKVTIDLGELYAPLMRVAVDEVRSINEQILYYVKKSLKSNGSIEDGRDKVKAHVRRNLMATNDDSVSCSYYANENLGQPMWF